jgi:P2-related tail formation protein
MHPLFQKASGLTETIIAAAIEVHRDKGPGLSKAMKLLDVPLGLLINFHEMKVTDGVSRLILPGANL